MDSKRGIGKNNELPWYVPGDMRYFKLTTSTVMHAGHRNLVIMGRNTWDSLPEKMRPLPDRMNAVLSKTMHHSDANMRTFTDLEYALAYGQTLPSIERIFVIGGAQLYTSALPLAEHIYITEIDRDYDCDVFFPEIKQDDYDVIWRGERTQDIRPVDAPFYQQRLLRKSTKPKLNQID